MALALLLLFVVVVVVVVIVDVVVVVVIVVVVIVVVVVVVVSAMDTTVRVRPTCQYCRCPHGSQLCLRPLVPIRSVKLVCVGFSRYFLAGWCHCSIASP